MKVRCILFCDGGDLPGIQNAIIRRHSDSLELSFFIDDRKISEILNENCSYAIVLCQDCKEDFHADPDAAFRNARYLVSRERFWEAHEALEDAWRSAYGSRKDRIQALIWIVAAQVHWQMGQADTAVRMHQKAMDVISSDLEFHYPLTANEFDHLISRV
ncbi:MAG: DUF309 domain-containing protein [Thermoplasma acidophilum]|nr:DUF309 domain-containing protein [Thermoplasma acidophilum]